MILQHHHASIDLRALRGVLYARCDEIGLLSTVFLFCILVLPLPDCFSGTDDGGACCYCCQKAQYHGGFVSTSPTIVIHYSKPISTDARPRIMGYIGMMTIAKRHHQSSFVYLLSGPDERGNPCRISPPHHQGSELFIAEQNQGNGK